MSDFQIGDVVQPKSDSALMTVMELRKNPIEGNGPKNEVACIWYDGKKMQREVFDTKVLKEVKDHPIDKQMLALFGDGDLSP